MALDGVAKFRKVERFTGPKGSFLVALANHRLGREEGAIHFIRISLDATGIRSQSLSIVIPMRVCVSPLAISPAL